MKIKINSKEMEMFYKEIEKFKLNKDAVVERGLNEISSRLLRKTVKRTPVVTGQLRRKWNATKPQQINDSKVVVVYNSEYYAPYVEYGHRQDVGRYVPAIKKRLKKPWVNGQYMLTKSVDEVDAKKIIFKTLDKEIKKIWK